MDIISWFKKRGFRFVWQRGSKLIYRYGVRPNKGIHRIKKCVEAMAELDCAPTLFTPGIIVKRNPRLFRYLQEMGAEIAVHSYHHIHLENLPIPEAHEELNRAIHTFEHFGIENHGFRCPYLGFDEELLNSLPCDMFDYSSNHAILWDVVDQNEPSRMGLFYKKLEKYYHAMVSKENVCIPTIWHNMIEIPVCVPDDLQLHDGLLLNSEGVNQVWTRFLEQTYLRGELFTLLFHTELAALNNTALIELVRRARQYQPSVWIARLRDICDWWREKSKFGVEISSNQKELRLTFSCSPRATILVRGLDLPGSRLMWDGSYYRLQSNMLEVPGNPRPFIGLADGIPERVVAFLKEQGYILDSSETARFCGLILDTDILTKLPDDVELVNYIEASSAPLVRYWRWPNGAKSALSFTGDLDALSLMDYASRLFDF